MNTTWMDAQFVLDFYQTCLALLFWLLASFACLGLIGSIAFLFVDRSPHSPGSWPSLR